MFPHSFQSPLSSCGVQTRTFRKALQNNQFIRQLASSREMASEQSSDVPRITPIEQDDFKEWERLFRLYIEFYKSSLPDAQYRKTFERILDPTKDLYGLVLRGSRDPKKLYGLAHYFPMQTPWAEEQLTHLNGMLSLNDD